MKTEPKTKVIFRMFCGEVLALFPQMPATSDASTCQSYAHNGQHGAATPDMVIRASRPASSVEFLPLARELRRIGYGLDVRQRTGWTDYLKRKAKISHV